MTHFGGSHYIFNWIVPILQQFGINLLKSKLWGLIELMVHKLWKTVGSICLDTTGLIVEKLTIITSIWLLLKKKYFIYLFMRDTESEREAETQAEGEAGSIQGAWCETWSCNPRIITWAKADAQPLSHPSIPDYYLLNIIYVLLYITSRFF